MAERRRVTGLGTRLAVAIGAVVVVAFAGTFVAVYRGTGAQVRDQLEAGLDTSAASVRANLLTGGTPSAATATKRARRAIQAQPAFGPSSLLLLVDIPGSTPVTNEPELLRAPAGGKRGDETPSDRRREAGEAAALLDAPSGYSTVRLEDAGRVQLYSQRLPLRGSGAASITVGSPLEPVDAAQDGVRNAFLLAGSIALALVLAAVLLAATRTTAPLREMERTAEAVDAGDPSLRMPERGARETRHLAHSFNGMLGRIESYVSRQRQFVSDASHELRTPLTAIRGQAEVLDRIETPDREAIRATTEQIDRQVVRMESLVDDMLLTARADEAGPAAHSEIELRTLVADFLGGVDPAARRRIEAEQLPQATLAGDHDQLVRALANVVNNAVEHTSESGHVVIAAARIAGVVKLRIDDDGPGIPASERELVFERFHRSDASRGRRAGGSGLGLAITRAIVAAHGGTIRAEGSPLGGARIVIELPEARRST